MASTDDEAGDFMPSPVWRIALDPKRGDTAVNGVGNLAEGVGTAHAPAVFYGALVPVKTTVIVPFVIK